MTATDNSARMRAPLKQRASYADSGAFVLPFSGKGEVLIIRRDDFARLKRHADMVIDFIEKKIARVPGDDARLRMWNSEVVQRLAQFYQKTEWRVLIFRWASGVGLPRKFVRTEESLARDFFRTALGIHNEALSAPAVSDLAARCEPEYSAGLFMQTDAKLPDKPLANAIADFPALDTFLREPRPRNCCALFPGGALGILTTKYLDLEDVPGHKFGESGFAPDDSVGHVYTARAGFVDLGHVRDLADTTRFLASKAIELQRGGGIVSLSAEGGSRKIRFKAADQHFPDLELAAMVAVRAAYDLAIWHEIVTWFNFVRHSSFSPEDNFSNLLGCLIGAKACLIKGQQYNRSIDQTLMEFLKNLHPQPAPIARKAIQEVTGLWFDMANDVLTAPLQKPEKNTRLLRRHVVPLPSVTPWLVTDLHGKSFYFDPLQGIGVDATFDEGLGIELDVNRTIDFDLGEKPQPYVLPVPQTTAKGIKLTDFYAVDIQVDTDQVPARVLSGLKNRGRVGSTAELLSIVDLVRVEILKTYPDGDRPISEN